MRAKEIVNESKTLRTEQGPIYENPSKRVILNQILNGENLRGIAIYDTFWVAHAYDMIHADIAVNTGLSMDYETPENADLFMITTRGDNKFEVDIFGPDITFEELPRPVKQAMDYVRQKGYTVQVVKDDRIVNIFEPYVNETASAGATAAGAVATVNQPAMAVQRRTGPYMNHTVVGPDGKPIKHLGGKKKKKKTKEALKEEIDTEYCLYEGCHYYALAMYDSLGWPLYLLVDETRDDFDIGFDIIHVVVKNPETNKFVDVEGEKSLKTLENQYNVDLIPKEISREELMSLMGESDEYPLYGFDEEEYNKSLEDVQKKKKKNLNEGKLYKVRDIPVIEKPNSTQLENLANKSKWNSVRITLDNRMNLWAWPADTLTHSDVEHYMETYIDEDFESQEMFNFTLMKGKDGVVWKAFADNGIADSISFDRMMSIRPVERAIGQADFDPNASSEFWAPNRWGM